MRTALALAAASLVVACSAGPDAPPPAATVEQTPADDFLAAIHQHCGQAFAGRIAANDPATADDPFVGKALVMHVGAHAHGQRAALEARPPTCGRFERRLDDVWRRQRRRGGWQRHAAGVPSGRRIEGAVHAGEA